MPQTMTGIILKLFASICTGKLTYLSASYWQVLAYTFDREIATYFQRGAFHMIGSREATTMIKANSTEATLLQKTMNTESSNMAPAS